MINTDHSFLWIHLLASGLPLIIGLYIWINPPKNVDIPVGLNLPISIHPKLNLDVWTEFHRYAGKIMSMISLIPLVLGSCLISNTSNSTIVKHEINWIESGFTISDVLFYFNNDHDYDGNTHDKDFR